MTIAGLLCAWKKDFKAIFPARFQIEMYFTFSTGDFEVVKTQCSCKSKTKGSLVTME